MLATGIYGYPKEDATKIAFEALREYFDDNPALYIKILIYSYCPQDYSILHRLLNALS